MADEGQEDLFGRQLLSSLKPTGLYLRGILLS